MLRRYLKILFLAADKYPPFRVDVSVLFGKEIAGRGHVIDWILQSDKPLKRDNCVKLKSGSVYVGKADKISTLLSKLKNRYYDIVHDLKVFKLLNRNTYNCVIVRDKFISALIALSASKIYKTKFIYWLSYPFPEASLHRLNDRSASLPLYYFIKGHVFRILLYKVIIPLSNYVFVQTERIKENIMNQGIDASIMTSVPMAVDLEEIPFFGYKNRLSQKQKQKLVVYLGTLLKTRRMDFLIKVFVKIVKSEMNAKLYLIGGSKNPHDEQILIDIAKKLRIEKSVKITGFLPQKKAWCLIKDADVCVSPIYPSPILNYGSPTKLLEYMAMGKATVANDHPEQKQVIGESGAGICVPYDENAFADAIIYLLNRPEVANEMGIKGRKYIEKYRNYNMLADIVEEKLFQICK